MGLRGDLTGLEPVPKTTHEKTLDYTVECNTQGSYVYIRYEIRNVICPLLGQVQIIT